MNRGRLQLTTSGQTHGHSTVDSTGAYGVAATPAVGPFPGPFGPASRVETFSSDRPRRIFYHGNGTPFTASLLASGGKVLDKPDITAADGVAVTGVGGFPNPFFGTSAAAPHAAAIAALLKSAIPGLTSAQVRSALTSTAIDIEAAGFDRDSGAGFPGFAAATGTRVLDAYSFESCVTSVPSCVTVTMTNSAVGANPALLDVAYIPSFDPANLSLGYAADPAASQITGGPISFSFDLPGGGTPFALAVHEVNPGLAVGANYSLSVSGGCFGNCSAPNRVPVAKAKNVTVFASAVACNAAASADDGSFDPDGDALTVTQSPAGPYALGTTPVLLTVVDPRGATSQAMGSVTVVDRQAPVVNNVSTTPSRLWPPNHKMVDVAVGFDLSDSCGGTCALTVSSNEPPNGTGDGETSPDWSVVDSHHVQLRAERSGKGNGRTYTLTLTCTDAAGNATVKKTTVFVPHNQ